MIYFLSSIPRSGSTLLASLLGQRSDTHVSKTSNLYETLEAVYNVFHESKTTKAAGCTNDELHRIFEGIIRSKYSDIDKKYIFDKDIVWTFI